jgi:hypothetical protein
MKNSMFYKLTQVENSKESSSILIAALCQLYDPIKQRFVFNNKTTFQFCTKEVANVLGIKDIGTDYPPVERSKFPTFMYDLKKKFVGDNGKTFKSSHLRIILKDMLVDDEHNKLYFKQLLSYFLVEQFLLCSSDSKTLRSSSWVFVKDLEAFEQVNWAKAVFDHICESLKDLKEKMRKPGEQHCFKGAAPVLEVCFAQLTSHSINNVCFEHFPIHVIHI